jgi:LysM repeat protein
VSSTEIPLLQPGDAPGLAAPDLTAFPATATLPPITLIVPTRPPLATDTPDAPPTEAADAPLPTPVFDLPTTEPLPLDPLPTAALPDVLPASETLVFRTPSSPLGPVTPMASPTPFQLPPAAPSGLITPTAFTDPITSSAGGEECVYIVRSGENLFRIAVNNNVTLAELRQANPEVSGDLIQPGQRLRLPNCAGSAAPAAPPENVEQPGLSAPVGGTVHTVVAGDTLFNIARKYGVTVQAIVQANNLANPNALSIGQQLVIP